LASFQALRHRLADSAVSAEATRWLGREAAYQDDARSVARAAWYASTTAAALVPELLQMCGARGFTHEFGLHLFIMRLNCLRLELGGIDRLGLELSRLPVDHDAAAVAVGHR
jgi:alkylation response protein AidB-like acyl-CoA dehydrogenase